MAVPLASWNGEGAFARLYAEHSPRVAGLARRLVARRDLVDDVVQETFLRAYRIGLHLDTDGDDARDPWPWLAHVARNVCHDVHRRACVVAVVPIEGADFPSSEPGPDAAAEDRARAHLIGQALANLPTGQQELLRQHHVDGLPCGVIAREGHTTTEGVKSALRRARAAFRARYEGWRGLWPEVAGGGLSRLGYALRSGGARIPIPAMRPGVAGALAALFALGMAVPSGRASEVVDPDSRALAPPQSSAAPDPVPESSSAHAQPVASNPAVAPEIPVGGRLISFQPPESPDVPPTPASTPGPSVAGPAPEAPTTSPVVAPPTPGVDVPLPALPPLPDPASIPGAGGVDDLAPVTAPLLDLVGGLAAPLLG
ncbi:MAG: sigma-70 family RNA polymerase sigma factor [Actinobacteria bacterium]|nr:sigma-70 family RNA polymerase sigma factor [Actinomycetota bacterium]